MERMISQTLAENFTSWCNFEYLLPLSFLQHSADMLDMEITPDGYDRKVMVWRIEELLRDIEAEEFQPLRRYLNGKNLDVKRYQLADQLSNIFDQYQLMRPEMLNAWAENRLTTKEPSEIWQRTLWMRLAGQVDSAPHRGIVLQQVINALTTRKDLAGKLPERVSVFGLSIMPPLFLRYLQGLALHSDVHLYVLSPCREYWGDIESRRKILLRSINDESGMAQELDDTPESHPLLISLGQQGRDFQRMLFDDVHFELEFDSYQDPLDRESPTLLRQLQSDLLAGAVEALSTPWQINDDSIRIISCHSKLREITILKDHILRWLYEEPELELRDIVVMAPDIQEYAALIPAVFKDIQHSVSDRSLRRRNPVIAAFDSFLALFSGRFGWDELLDLLNEPAISEKLQLSATDLENIQHWVTSSGIRWGLSAKQRGEMGLPEFEECSWAAGLERLLMGYAIDSDNFVDGILPFPDIEGGGAAALGGLCQFVKIVERARNDFSTSYTLSGWADLLVSYSRELFYDESSYADTKDFLELQEIMQDLGEKQGVFHQSDIDFTVICTWLEHMARETRSSSGFLRGQLTFCSMLPMRSIPFKVVCLIGLNDGLFPKNDRYATFDLMGAGHRPGDRSRRMDDRYQFLEALVAAREKLYLSYIGQSIKNNEEIPPSVVVTELLEVLTQYYHVTDCVIRHPLHPFSSNYFNGNYTSLFSYSATYCNVAEKLAMPDGDKKSWWSGDRQSEIKEIDVRDLLRFYSNPQRYFVRNCLGIWLGDDFDIVAESENFTLDGLENYLIDQELVSAMIAGANRSVLDDLHRKLSLAGRWPLGTPGDLKYEKKIEELSGFAKTISDCGIGNRLDDLLIDEEVGGYAIRGVLSNVYEGGMLLCRYSKFKGKDLLSAWLHHLLYSRATGNTTTTYLFSSDSFQQIPAGSPPVPDLETLVKIFVAGNLRPSPLYIDPGVEWVKKYLKNGAGDLDAARRKLVKMVEDGYDAELSLLLRNCEVEILLGEEFEEVCQKVLEPIWRNVND